MLIAPGGKSKILNWAESILTVYPLAQTTDMPALRVLGSFSLWASACAILPA